MGIRLGERRRFSSGVLVETRKAPPVIPKERKKVPKALIVTTGLLAATAAGLLNPLLAIPAYFATTSGIGLLTSSEKARAGAAAVITGEAAGKIGEFIDDPLAKVKEIGGSVIEKAKEIGGTIKDSAVPILVGGAALTAAAAGLAIATKGILENIKEKDIALPTGTIKPMGDVSQIPTGQLPKTVIVSDTPRKRYKRTTAKKQPTITQTVRVNVITNSRVGSTQNYLKEGYL